MENGAMEPIVIAFIVIIIGGAIWFAFVNTGSQEINSFEECAAAGYQILESYPEQCKTPDGKTFVKEYNQESGIMGIVLLGPQCPVVREGEECPDKPFETALALTTPDGTQTIREFRSNANGEFKVSAAPGEYAIRSAVAANILPYCSSNETITVTTGFTETTVYCDTGIR